MNRETDKCILWDFDNTLAYRRDGMWRAALVEALAEKLPGHQISADSLRKPLRNGFPWHVWQIPHPELSSPELWWQHVESILANAYRFVGVDESKVEELASAAHCCYVNPESFILFPDSIPALKQLVCTGWKHIILSNHVPELEDLVNHLGLGSLVERVITSALTGYEKPHPEAYAIARKVAGDPAVLWMVGDNPDADVEGAERCDIPAILVRSETGTAKRVASDLYQVMDIVNGSCVRRNAKQHKEIPLCQYEKDSH